MQNEPVITANGIVAFVSAVIVLAISFGAPITEAQKAAIIGVVVIVAPLAAAWYIRRHTTSLADPRDADGAPLSRPDNSPTIAQVRAAKVRWDRGGEPWPKS